MKEVLSEYLEWRQDDEDVVRPWIVSVTLMMFNDRVLLTHREDYPYTWTAGWCYDKGGAAVLAAMAWDVENERSPVGFKKVTGDLRPAPADEGCSCQYDVR